MAALLIAGALGGLVRGLVGFIKHQYAYKNTTFSWPYFLSMMAISSGIGLTVTWSMAASGLKIGPLSDLNPAVSFIIGYAGGDFVENIYKIILGKDTLYPNAKRTARKSH